MRRAPTEVSGCRLSKLEAGFYQQVLFHQRYVCLAGANHPRIRGRLDLETYEAERHAVVTTSGTGHLIVDREIARQNITRRVALELPNFLGLAFVVENTDLLVTMPARLSEILTGRGHFNVYPVPFPLPDYLVKQHWHERYHHDPGSRWLRGEIWALLGESGAARETA